MEDEEYLEGGIIHRGDVLGQKEPPSNPGRHRHSIVPAGSECPSLEPTWRKECECLLRPNFVRRLSSLMAINQHGIDSRRLYRLSFIQL
jgi:hypothetical protein